ncbi:MAG: hypothetical protein ACT4P4_03775 [Betaproteobacteria bacterium]
MSGVINARIPKRVEQRLVEYCVRRGVTKSRVVVDALDRYLSAEQARPNFYSLIEDLIPKRGSKRIRSDRVRELAREAFARRRSR